MRAYLRTYLVVWAVVYAYLALIQGVNPVYELLTGLWVWAMWRVYKTLKAVR